MKKQSSFFRSIGSKLIIISSVVVLLSLSVLTVVVDFRMSAALKDEAQAKLEAIHSEKQKIVLDVIKRAKDDCEVIASTLDVKNAIDELILYHEEMDISPTGPYDTTGRGENLTKSYEEIYKNINSNLSKYNDIYGYRDVLLICAKHGHVMYSNVRGGDLGENLSSGEFADSNLARLWNKVITTRVTTIVDLEKYAPRGGVPAFFIGTPIIENNELISVVVIQLNDEQITDLLIDSAGMGETGDVYCVGEDLLMRTNSRFSDKGNTTILKQKVDTTAGRIILQENSSNFSGIFPDYTGKQVLSVYSHLTIDEKMEADFDWAIIAEVAMEEINKPIKQLLILVIILALTLLVSAIAVMILFSKSITVPIRAGVSTAEEIASGNLEISIEPAYINRRDEIGQLANSLEHMIDRLSNTVGSVLVGSEQIASASEEIATANQDLSTRTEQQASALEETSAAIEEMNSSIKSNADNTTTADSLSRDAARKTEEGSKAVSEMIDSMNEISDSSNRIADIIEVITNIAFQTNLLALNASIEAARAGEHGKGFAVVAVEVRKLSKRSNKAAEEITAIIKNSNQKVIQGVDVANTAGTVLEEINDAVKKVTALVSEISAASQEQLLSVDQIDKTLSTLDENTQRNAAMVEEAASATEELSAQARELTTAMRFFKIKKTVKQIAERE